MPSDSTSSRSKRHLADANLALASQIRLDRPGRIGGHTKRPGGVVAPRAMAPDLEVQMPEDRIAPAARKLYYLEGYVRIEAESDEAATKLFEEAGLGIAVEVIDGVTLDFQGPWDEIVEIDEPECICPPDLLARGGFRGGCPVHAA